jgi:hypothetical protein
MHYITLILFYLFTGFLKLDSLTRITPSTGKILLKQVVIKDSLFTLHLNNKGNKVEIIPPQNSSFSFPDSTVSLEVFENGILMWMEKRMYWLIWEHVVQVVVCMAYF